MRESIEKEKKIVRNQPPSFSYDKNIRLKTLSSLKPRAGILSIGKVGWYGAVVKAPCPEACMRSGELCRLCVRNAQLTQLLDLLEKDVKIGCGSFLTSSALLSGAHSGGRVSPSPTGSAFSGGLPFEIHPAHARQLQDTLALVAVQR